jgi:hypothetical protein
MHYWSSLPAGREPVKRVLILASPNRVTGRISLSTGGEFAAKLPAPVSARDGTYLDEGQLGGSD